MFSTDVSGMLVMTMHSLQFLRPMCAFEDRLNQSIALGLRLSECTGTLFTIAYTTILVRSRTSSQMALLPLHEYRSAAIIPAVCCLVCPQQTDMSIGSERLGLLLRKACSHPGCHRLVTSGCWAICTAYRSNFLSLMKESVMLVWPLSMQLRNPRKESQTSVAKFSAHCDARLIGGWMLESWHEARCAKLCATRAAGEGNSC